MMEKFAVKIRDNAHIYIHSTLQNAAWFLKEEVEKLIKEKGDGIGLKIMACAKARMTKLLFGGAELLAEAKGNR
jgi:hypothetical protein